MTEKYNNIPEDNSLDSMEGVEINQPDEKDNVIEKEQGVIDEKFTERHQSYLFAVEVENKVKEELGTFDFFSQHFFETIYSCEDVLLDSDENDSKCVPVYIVLDIFNRLLESGLLKEDDEESFCFAFITEHNLQKQIERYLVNKKHNKPMNNVDIDSLKLIIDKYLPNIQKISLQDNIDEIDRVIRDRSFKLHLADIFRQNFTMRDVSEEDLLQKSEEELWHDFIEQKSSTLDRFPSELMDGFPGVQNYARRLDLTEARDESIKRPYYVSWPHQLAHMFRTLGEKDRNLDFYSIKRLREVLMDIKNEFSL